MITIVVEGLDGSGKKTQTELLVKRLKKDGYNVYTQSFPNYGTKGSQLVEDYLKGNFAFLKSISEESDIKFKSLLYTIDRVMTFGNPITYGYDNDNKCFFDLLKQNNDNDILVLDRYTTSNILHQSMKSDNPLEYVKWLEDIEYNQLKLPRPDMVLFLNNIPEQSMVNISKRCIEDNVDVDAHENIMHLSGAYKNYDKIKSELQWTNIDCNMIGEDGFTYMRDIESISNDIYDKVISKIK